ncbi:MAG: hypothetical protein ACPLRU_02990 [Desulfofundulus sp.]
MVHELLHLKIPNHGPLFKALLRGFLAKYRGECGFSFWTGNK